MSNRGAEPPSSSSAEATHANESESPGTTTLALGDGGVQHETKLPEVGAETAAQQSPTSLRKESHTHDPGRGLADIRAAITSQRDAARACYDSALATHPGIEGNLMMRWTIDPKGNVAEVLSDPSRSEIVEPSVIDCISHVVQGIQFAPSAGGFETNASYPFNFHPHASHHAEPQ